MIEWLLKTAAAVGLALIARDLWGWLPRLSVRLVWAAALTVPRQWRQIRREEWGAVVESEFEDRRISGFLWALRLVGICSTEWLYARAVLVLAAGALMLAGVTRGARTASVFVSETRMIVPFEFKRSAIRAARASVVVGAGLQACLGAAAMHEVAQSWLLDLVGGSVWGFASMSVSWKWLRPGGRFSLVALAPRVLLMTAGSLCLGTLLLLRVFAGPIHLEALQHGIADPDVFQRLHALQMLAASRPVIMLPGAVFVFLFALNQTLPLAAAVGASMRSDQFGEVFTERAADRISRPSSPGPLS